MSETIQHWTAALTALIETCNHLKRVTVLAETDSTQEAARRLSGAPGDVIVAGRQTSGRGRMGRAWSDSNGEGVAVTIVLPHGPTERLAVLSAVATAEGLQTVCGETPRIGIKWPNDIMAKGRKLAGILIEQDSRRAIVGIGINVSQKTWPSDLGDRAVSVHQLGVDVDRLAVLGAVLKAVDAAIDLSDTELTEDYMQRDVLTGSVTTLYKGGDAITGRVIRIDPMHFLVVQTDQGECRLAAATTSTHPPP